MSTFLIQRLTLKGLLALSTNYIVVNQRYEIEFHKKAVIHSLIYKFMHCNKSVLYSNDVSSSPLNTKGITMKNVSSSFLKQSMI